ncbi:NAD(P)H:quinone oxidoreductase [Nocardiopsis alba]|uniref:NAD(P)H:quinone oxidoreductase n=1 Tax=Nocardiopsis alba TaxID=53437 RepID=A0A7K2INW2_9ACTN|nr:MULTISPECIES: NAD(P)H:quinone oxidoreductase [Nocardiopsis]MEC3894044.1 NAD(P)H:quinone oxidoreductase [Nocardiopsis sp. LDBS1602]MYR31659.1 NAD(P)H:quinone oxidoreductase [Nocardiopsis alba]
MTEIAVIVHSMAGSSARLARAISEGAEGVEDTKVRLLRVPDPATSDADLAANPRFGHLFTEHVAEIPVATFEDLAQVDGIILGCGTRFGGMSAPMRHFLESASGLWMTGALNGKVGGAFATASTPHGGQEKTIHDLLTALMHFGVVIVPPGYGDPIQHQASSPYGAAARAGGPTGLVPTDDDLTAGRFLGRRVAETTGRLTLTL